MARQAGNQRGLDSTWLSGSWKWLLARQRPKRFGGGRKVIMGDPWVCRQLPKAFSCSGERELLK